MGRPERSVPDAEIQGQSRWGLEGRTTIYHPVELPLCPCQDSFCCRRDEFIAVCFDFIDDSIHGVSNRFGALFLHIVLDGEAVQMTTSDAESPRKPLRPLEDLVWNRDRRFHTISITTARWVAQFGCLVFVSIFT